MAAIIIEPQTYRGTFPKHRVPRRQEDDLPRHVKGEAYFFNAEKVNPLLTGYYVGEAPNDRSIEFYRLKGQDNWYFLDAQRGDPDSEGDFWTTTSELKVTAVNTIGLGWWSESNPQHPTY